MAAIKVLVLFFDSKFLNNPRTLRQISDLFQNVNAQGRSKWVPLNSSGPLLVALGNFPMPKAN